MVYSRENSQTMHILDSHMCRDISNLIEGYLLPMLDILRGHMAIMRQKLQCGYDEYIEMEIGNSSVRDGMFIDSCKDGCLSDVYALLSSGPRNLKAGLAAAVLYNRNHIARLLIALDAIDSSRICPDLIFKTQDYIRTDFIVHVTNPSHVHLLAMLGAINYPDEILLALHRCIKFGSIVGVEILISKTPVDKRDLIINEVIIHAVNNNMIHIIEYALDNGADIQTGIKHASRIKNQEMLDFLLNLNSCGNRAKRKRSV